jgi:hypothetical protein
MKYFASLRTESREKQKNNQNYRERRLRLEEIGGLRHFHGAKVLSLISQNKSLNVLSKTPFEC